MKTYRQPFAREWPITQAFGAVIPGVTYNNKPHTGIDYGCPAGTEILASAGGIVMEAGWDNTGYGNMIIILHDAKHATLYAHLNKCLVFRNQKVEQGDPIGLSGATGYATGPHLHFEARKVWNDCNSHFDPMLLPLMSVDDSVSTNAECGMQNAETQDPGSKEVTVPETAAAPEIPMGRCRVACGCANVRKWADLSIEKQVYKGEPVYVYEMSRMYNGLTFLYIGAGSCMAAYDSDGTAILKAAEEKK